jgi:hypothetical protein
VRDRVERLAPVFTQGSEVLPLLYDGVLYWTLELYSASEDYPLSERWVAAGGTWSYFHHAATALIESGTGRVRLITATRPDPVARTWMSVVPDLWTSIKDIPEGLAAQLPPLKEGALVQMRTFARHGSRLAGPIVRHFPDSVSLNSGTTSVLVSTRGGLVPALAVPLLDSGDELGGIATIVGGAVRRTFWDTTTVPRLQWSESTDRLRRSLDSARAPLPGGTRREPRVRFGFPHAVMSSSGPVIGEALYFAGSEGDLTILQTGILLSNRTGTGGLTPEAVARATGGSIPLDVQPAPSSSSHDSDITAIYERMRDALRRADWSSFGAAFDSLGRLLGKPPG